MIIDQDKLINFIKNNRMVTFFQIVKKFNINSRQNKDVTILLNKLKQNGQIGFSRKTNSFYIPSLLTKGRGVIKINNKDYGFINYEFENKEIRAIVFKEFWKDAINEDEVEFRIFKDFEKTNYYFAIVDKIISRKNKYLYGFIDENLNFVPTNFSNSLEFVYSKENITKNTFVKYEIELVKNEKIYIKLIETYKNINEPFADIDFIIKSMNINDKFDLDVMKEANEIPETIKGKTDDGRTDLTKLLIVTIDGEKTRDFDDAINVVKTKNNTYILGVHIADVSHYVKNNSAIDRQALERGTSIYLVDRVIPMLPEKLSNGICSLNPNVDRYTLTLESEIDSQGNIIWTKLYPSTINSKYRLTYNQVNNYENDEIINKDKELKLMIKHAYELSAILSKTKINDGFIDFEIKEPIIELDENGKTKNIKVIQRLSSEVLIENFMVFANERVSELIAKKNLTNIYRIHEAPNEEKFNNLSLVLKTIGLNNIKVVNSEDPKTFSNLVNEIKKERFDDFIKINLLRTMQKAKYSPTNIGHFGLASKFYSHFTSPIRRYPDLILHRIIWELFFKQNKEFENEIKNKINYIANQSSTKEEEAVVIERKVNDVKKSEFYNSKIGQILKGIIVSIKKFGLFVEFADKVDALVHTSNLSNNLCIMNENETEITCGDKKYKLGDIVKVEIIGISKLEGKVDAKIV